MATIDSLHDEQAPEVPAAPRSTTTWAWVSSCALFAGAAALAIGPRVLPSASDVIAQLARHGLTWPLLGGCGLVIAAIATTVRRPRHDHESSAPSTPEHAPSAQLSEDPLAREIAAELARIRGGLHDLRVDFVYVKDALSRLQQSASHSDHDSNRDAEAAIFRLAASLDQLGGRVEHELASQRTWLTEVIQNQSQRANSHAESLPVFADPYTQAFEGDPHEIALDHGFVASEDDVHVEVTLDDDASWMQGLGVLDQIDEPRGPMPHQKTSHSGRASSADALLGELEQASTSRAMLDEKMARLRSLLSDPAVQRALEAQSR